MNIIALDMRGHGRGIHGEDVSYPGGENFLEDNADDVAAAMDVLGIDKAIVVGYSMGTTIAPLLWKRHPERVEGLVLCAGAAKFPQTLAGTLAETEKQVQRIPWQLRRVAAHATDLGLFRAIPLLNEAGRNDPLLFAQAGLAIEKYDARPWIGDIDVPTAVLVMENDHLVPRQLQADLLKAIPGAQGYFIFSKAGHLAAGFGKEFPTQLGAAVRDVASRASLGLN
jgi:pimeloyl-ACP methyl ester carboxylesterase